MKFLRELIPNLLLTLSAAVMLLSYLDGRNPMMGFASGIPFQVIVIANFLCAVVGLVLFYVKPSKPKEKPGEDKDPDQE